VFKNVESYGDTGVELHPRSGTLMVVVSDHDRNILCVEINRHNDTVSSIHEYLIDSSSKNHYAAELGASRR
jgi:hypothetical protein